MAIWDRFFTLYSRPHVSLNRLRLCHYIPLLILLTSIKQCGVWWGGEAGGFSQWAYVNHLVFVSFDWEQIERSTKTFSREFILQLLIVVVISRLPATITQLESLTHLGLNDVSLTQLPQDIGQLVNLRSLEVRENLIRTLPTSISYLVHLQRLDLGQNELDELVSFSFYELISFGFFLACWNRSPQRTARALRRCKRSWSVTTRNYQLSIVATVGCERK